MLGERETLGVEDVLKVHAVKDWCPAGLSWEWVGVCVQTFPDMGTHWEYAFKSG